MLKRHQATADVFGGATVLHTDSMQQSLLKHDWSTLLGLQTENIKIFFGYICVQRPVHRDYFLPG